MSTARKVAILNLNDTRRDPRVLRTARSLRARNFDVWVHHLVSDAPEREITADGLPLLRIDAPSDYSDGAMAQLAVESPLAGEIIEQAHPAVMSLDRGRGLRRLIDEAQEQANSLRCLMTGKKAPRRHLENEIAAIRSIAMINLAIFRDVSRLAPDIVFCNDLDTLLAGVMLKQACGARLIYDAHEIYPEQLSYEMRSQFWRNYYHRLEGLLAPRSDGIMTVCDTIGSYLARVHGARGAQTVLNVPDASLQVEPAILERRNAPRRVLYHGAYYPYRGLDEIIAAIPLVERAVFEFRGIGGYEATLREKAEALGLGDRLVFRPAEPVLRLIPAASGCDIGLSPFVNSCLNTEAALPNKIFEYMMAGLATASSDLPEMRALTRRERTGTLFGDLSPKAIADALNTMLADEAGLDASRRRAWEAANTRYNWREEEPNFLRFFASAVG